MSETPKLIPRVVTLTSEVKFFGLEKGQSDGSQASVTFDIPPEMATVDLRKAIFEEKERLDLLVLISERIKGSISKEFFTKRRSLIVSSYDKILNRNQAEETDV